MLRKMRWRFVCAAMAAIVAVTLVLVAVINLVNYSATTSRLDSTIDSLSRFSAAPADAPSSPAAPGQAPGMPQEARYATRFFIVELDAQNTPQQVFTDYVATVTKQQARQYAQNVLSQGKKKGFYLGFRYRIMEEQVIFLHAGMELQSTKTLAMVSLLVALGSLAVVFLLVVLFSKKATGPYARALIRQKQFITDASHELKTPLTSIATSADVLALEQENNEWVTNIQRQTLRLSKLVGDLISLSRLDEEAPLPEKLPFSLSEAAWETVEPFAAQAGAQGKQFTQHIEDSLTLCGDRASIQQMLSILLDNALKYSTPQGTIRLEVYRRHNSCYICVYNTCQIDNPADLVHVFDRFYRLDSSRSSATGGTGVGLSIAQAIVQAHGGKIGVKTDNGKSVVFQVVL